MENTEMKKIRKELDMKGKIISYMFPSVFIKVYKLGISFG